MKIERSGLLDKIAGARAAVAGGVTRANTLLLGSLWLVLDKDVLSCDWKGKDTLAATLSDAAGVFHCWQGRNRMAVDAIGLDVDGKLGEALVVSRDNSGTVMQKIAAGSARTLVSQSKPFTINDAANPEPGEALAVIRNGKLVRLVAVLYKDPVANIIATLETNEVPADALTCKPTFGWYSLLLPRYDLKTFHGTYCLGQPDCTTVVLAAAAPGAYSLERPEFKCYTCGKSTKMAAAKATARPTSGAAAPAAPAPAKPDPADVAAEQTKDEIVHTLEGKDFTGAFTRLDVQSMPKMLRILDLLDPEQVDLLLANLDTPHGRYTERLHAALTVAAAVDGRADVDEERFAADLASLKKGDLVQQQKGELLAYLRENDNGTSVAVDRLTRRLKSTVLQSPEVDGRMIVAVSGDPIAAGSTVRYRVVATGSTAGDESIRWRWVDSDREPEKLRSAGRTVGPDSETNRVLDDGSWEKLWPEPGTYEVICQLAARDAAWSLVSSPTVLKLTQNVLPVDAADSPLALAFDANLAPPDYAHWRESLAPTKAPPPLKSRIECSGPNPALVSTRTEHTYTVIPAGGAKTFLWYLRGSIPDDLASTYTSNDKPYKRGKLDGDDVLALPTSDDGRTATWILSFPGRFEIVCEQTCGDGRVLACVYTQVVEQRDVADERARQGREVRKHLTAADEAIRKLNLLQWVASGGSGNETLSYVQEALPVRANYLSYKTSKVVTVPMFIGLTRDGKVLLLDLTPAADRMEYEGSDVADAVTTFESRNAYPKGRIRLAVPSNDLGVTAYDRAFDATGGPWTTRWASWLSDASFALGLLAMAVPGGQVMGWAILLSSAAGAAAGGLSIYDELQKREPDYARVAVDVVGVAGAIIGAASGFHGIWLKSPYRISDRAGRFYHLSGIGSSGTGAVMLHFDTGLQLEKALQEPDPQKRREAVQELLVGFLLQEMMLAVQVRDLHNNVKPHVNAEVEVHDHLLGVAGPAYWIEKAGGRNVLTLFERIEERFQTVKGLAGESPTTAEVVKNTRAGLDEMVRRGASKAARKAFLADQLDKILGASDETPFDHAYSIRDELIKEYIDPPAGDGKKSDYRNYMKDVMRMLARDGLRYSEQSVSAKKLATAITEESVAAAREAMESESHGRLDIDLRFLAMIDTATIASPRATQAKFNETLGYLNEVMRRGDVAGIDIAGPEAGKFDPGQGMQNVQTLYDLLKVAAKTRNRPLVLRPHVGEGYAPPGAPEGAHVETARHNMTTLLDHLKKTGYSLAKGREDGVVIRFGHAAHATPEQLKLMAEMGIYAEANLGSNAMTGSVPDLSEHPLLYNLYYETPTILSTDGGGVMSTTLDEEYGRAADIIEHFKTDPTKKIMVDGKEKGWADLSAEEQSRMDVARLKKWAKAYGTVLKAGDRWSMDSRQRKIVFQ